MSGLRVVAVTPSYAPCVGGAEHMLQAVAERLVRRGHRVTVITANGATHRDLSSRDGARLPPEAHLNGVTLHRVRPDLPAARAFRYLTDLRGGWRLGTLLAGEAFTMLRGRPAALAFIGPVLREPADVVLAVNWAWPPAYGVHLAHRLRPFPLVGVPILHTARPWALSPLYRTMLSACDGVLAMTEAEAGFIEARGKPGARVTGTGVDPDRFRSRDGEGLRARVGLGRRPVVGFVGRQDRGKGVLVLIEAMRLLWSTRPEVVLLMAGQRAHRSEEVARELDALEPAARTRVVLVDDFPDEDGPSILDACDVVALPSVEEAFGMVYLEAWMCGKPVVGAGVPSTECVVADGTDGLLAAPLDAVDLCRCLGTLLSDPGLRERLGREGRTKAMTAYTWDHITDRWESELSRVAALPRRRGALSTEEPRHPGGQAP